MAVRIKCITFGYAGPYRPAQFWAPLLTAAPKPAGAERLGLIA